jgi:hypothetical protein
MGFNLGFNAQRQVNGHLVTVKVGVEAMTDQRCSIIAIALTRNGSKA